MNVHTDSETQTCELATHLAKLLKTGDILMLRGPLGAGKSVVARSLIRALCDEKELEVPSPTFTLVQSYEGISGAIHHYDLYRLTTAEEVYELGWEDSLASAITIVEWPERLGHHLPPRRAELSISPVPASSEGRHIEFAFFNMPEVEAAWKTMFHAD